MADVEHGERGSRRRLHVLDVDGDAEEPDDEASLLGARSWAPMDPVRHTAAYELVVDQIRRSISTGRFLPGDKLPPERELAKQLGVSRTTVREAARVLEGEGLLETRRGATGGLVVLPNPPMDGAAYEMIVADLDAVDHIFEFRIANETAAARGAALRRTDEDLEALRMALDTMDVLSQESNRHEVSSVAKFRAADAAFHLGLARASRNDLILRAVEDAYAALFRPIGAVFRELAPGANDKHNDLYDAVERQDPDAAAAAASEHAHLTWQRIHELLERPPRA